MNNLKTKTVRLAAVFGSALTLGVSVLVTTAPAQARAVAPPGTTARPHPAAASARPLGSFVAIPVAGTTSTFEIVNYASGYCLGIKGGSSTPGTDAVQWNCNGNPDQQWRIRATDGDYAQFENNDNLCLGVASGSTAEGANLIAWTCLGTNHPDQYWANIDSSCAGYEPLVNLKSNWVMGTQGGSSAEGTDLVQWNWQDSCNNQYWLLY